MKKYLFLGSIIASFAPVISIIACSNGQAKTLTSTKDTTNIDNVFGSSSRQDLFASEVNEKLGVEEFDSEDLNSFFKLRKISTLKGIYVVEKWSINSETKEGEKEQDKEGGIKSMEDVKKIPKDAQISYSYYIIKSSNTEVKDLEKARELIRKMREQHK